MFWMGLSLGVPVIGEAIATTYDCTQGYCDPTLNMLPGSTASWADETGNVFEAVDGSVDDFFEAGDNVPIASNASPDFVGTSNGDLIPVPDGATGPNPVANGQGFQYTDGSGGNGLDPRVTDVRVMDPTFPKGPSPGYPGGYVSYSNAYGQTVNPYTGQTIPKKDPYWHLPLSPFSPER